MALKKPIYPARLEIDYPAQLNRLTTFFRIFWIIPILFILFALTGDAGQSYVNEAGEQATTNGGGITTGLFLATALMIIFRQRYPRWWFNFALELNRFSARIGAYFLLLTDKYPSTVDQQSVHLELDYPDARQDLNRWLPLVKWLLAIPHYVVLAFLMVAAIGITVFAWFTIVFTGRYPQYLFELVVGINRWSLRVMAYAFLLTTDVYPPFSLK